MKAWLKLESVRDIQVFLIFVNFYKRFIKNFRRIVALLILKLQTMDKPTEDKAQSIQAEKQNVSNSASSIDRSIKNLSTGAKLTKFKKPDLL